MRRKQLLRAAKLRDIEFDRRERYERDCVDIVLQGIETAKLTITTESAPWWLQPWRALANWRARRRQRKSIEQADRRLL